MALLDELPAEIPFQVFGNYPREKLIRDLQDLYRTVALLVEKVNELEERIVVLEEA